MLYKSFFLQFETLCMKVTPQEVIVKIVGANHRQYQREADSEFVAVKDLLVREEGDWLTMDNGDL